MLQVNQQGGIGPEVRQIQGPSWAQQTWSRISRKSDNNNDPDPKLGGPVHERSKTTIMIQISNQKAPCQLHDQMEQNKINLSQTAIMTQIN